MQFKQIYNENNVFLYKLNELKKGKGTKVKMIF